MSKKIYIYIEDSEYKKGVEKYLAFEMRAAGHVKLIDKISDLSNEGAALLLTDSESKEIAALNNTKTYYLSDKTEAAHNEICKFNSFENILSSLEDREKELEEMQTKTIAVSSVRQGAGKSLIAREAARLLSARYTSCVIIPYPSRENKNGVNRLDKLLLNSMNNAGLELIEDEAGLYYISGFKLIEDYIDLDIYGLKNLITKLSKLKGIAYFIIEAEGYLDKTSRELISSADCNIIVRTEDDDDYYAAELSYIRKLAGDKSQYIEIINKVRNPGYDNELPYIYGIYDEEGETADFRHFSSKLDSVLEAL